MCTGDNMPRIRSVKNWVAVWIPLGIPIPGTRERDGLEAAELAVKQGLPLETFERDWTVINTAPEQGGTSVE